MLKRCQTSRSSPQLTTGLADAIAAANAKKNHLSSSDQNHDVQTILGALGSGENLNNVKLSAPHQGGGDPLGYDTVRPDGKTNLDHILERHSPQSTAGNAGKFADGTTTDDVKQIVNDTIENDPQAEPNTNGRPGTRYNADLGRTIGTASNGSPTSWGARRRRRGWQDHHRVPDPRAMTITLDYTDLAFDDDRAVLLAEETDFEYDLLYARIVFRVDAADFTIKDEYTPLLDASAGLRRTVDLLADGEARTYESPVSWAKITFARSGEQVAISANYTEATAAVTFTELQEAVCGFHQRVTQDLLARYPGLDETPGARRYFEPRGQGSSPGA